MTIYCFKLENTIVYVGQTVQKFNTRISNHFSRAREGQSYQICRALVKYKDSIKWEVLETCGTQEELDFLEIYYIKHFNPRYNLSSGGKQGFIPWNKGKKETRRDVLANISKSASRRKSSKRGKYSPEHIKKMSEGVKSKVRKAFICENNGVVYYNKVGCAKDLNIDARGISICLMPNTRLKSYKGYKFRYL
jgi:GIY-YIG catalytic domain